MDKLECLTCEDTGAVTCFHPVGMAAAIEVVKGMRTPDSVPLTQCAVPCTCRRGDLISVATANQSERMGRNRPPDIRITDSRAVRYHASLTDDMARAVIIDWAREYQAKVDQRQHDRYGVFEEFNRA